MNQNQARLLIGGIIILAVVGGGILFRNDLQGLLQKKTSDLPKPQAQEEQFTPAKPREVKGVSFIDGYELNLENAYDLTRSFEEAGIFGRTSLYNIKGQTTGTNPLREIHIIIRDKAIPGDKADYKSNIFFYMHEDILQVNIIKAPVALLEETAGDDILSEFVEAVYFITHRSAKESDITSETEKIMDSIKEKHDSYVVIKKK